MPLNFRRKITPETPDLKWAIGRTGRTDFMWTIVPPGTEFCIEEGFADSWYFSIFRWTYPLWSALDIKINSGFISYLRAGHSRKEYNKQYQGYDYDNLKAGCQRGGPLPMGNHVISVCQAAGILFQKKRGGFFLSLPDDYLGNETDAVKNALHKYLENQKVSRAQIENFKKYEEKKEQWNTYKDKQSKKNMEQIWESADVSQMNDIPADENLRERIRKQLIDEHKSWIENAILHPEHRLFKGTLSDLKQDFSSYTRHFSKEKVKMAARDYIRKAWMDIQNCRSK